MLSWWLYTVAVGTMLALAAWLGARAAWIANRTTRAVWALALLASAVVPYGVHRLGGSVRQAIPGLGIAEAGAPAAMARLAGTIAAISGATQPWLPFVWGCASVLLIVLALVAELRWRRRAAGCAAVRVCGVPARLSATEGPAVLGMLRPRVILPAWILSASVRERRLAVAHELHHARGGDLPLLWGAYFIVCLAPWSPPAWWMFARLRRAVEVDCDSRVLRAGRDCRAYGALLLRAAEARSPSPLVATGLLRRHSLVRERLARIVARQRRSRRSGWLPAVAAVGCLLMTATLPVPAATAQFTFTPAGGDAGTPPYGVVRRWEHTVTATPRGEQSAAGTYTAREVPADGVSTLRRRDDADPAQSEPVIVSRYTPSGTIREMPKR